ncbi:hypothetical protein EI969_04885 [Pseudomonas sp. PB101]|nr:hypothetical protein [Pseudomonas sp. PB101]
MHTIVPHWRALCTRARRSVGAGLLAMAVCQVHRVVLIASKPAPTVVYYFLNRSVRASATAGCTNLVISPPRAAISRTSVEEMNE